MSSRLVTVALSHDVVKPAASGHLGACQYRSSETINVDIGKTGPLFSTNTITAHIDDEIAFDVYPPHSVVQGNGFDNLCAFRPSGSPLAFFNGADFHHQSHRHKSHIDLATAAK
jgi:hypothetical protein